MDSLALPKIEAINNTITAPTMDNNNITMSRVVVYTSSNMIAKRRYDLEEHEISAIWLEVGLPRQTKILISNRFSSLTNRTQCCKRTGKSGCLAIPTSTSSNGKDVTFHPVTPATVSNLSLICFSHKSCHMGCLS